MLETSCPKTNIHADTLGDILKHIKYSPQPGDYIAHTEGNKDVQTHTLMLSDREPL